MKSLPYLLMFFVLLLNLGLIAIGFYPFFPFLTDFLHLAITIVTSNVTSEIIIIYLGITFNAGMIFLALDPKFLSFLNENKLFWSTTNLFLQILSSMIMMSLLGAGTVIPPILLGVVPAVLLLGTLIMAYYVNRAFPPPPPPNAEEEKQKKQIIDAKGSQDCSILDGLLTEEEIEKIKLCIKKGPNKEKKVRGQLQNGLAHYQATVGKVYTLQYGATKATPDEPLTIVFNDGTKATFDYRDVITWAQLKSLEALKQPPELLSIYKYNDKMLGINKSLKNANFIYGLPEKHIGFVYHARLFLKRRPVQQFLLMQQKKLSKINASTRSKSLLSSHSNPLEEKAPLSIDTRTNNTTGEYQFSDLHQALDSPTATSHIPSHISPKLTDLSEESGTNSTDNRDLDNSAVISLSPTKS